MSATDCRILKELQKVTVSSKHGFYRIVNRSE